MLVLWNSGKVKAAKIHTGHFSINPKARVAATLPYHFLSNHYVARKNILAYFPKI
jgi:hypothetical protein